MLRLLMNSLLRQWNKIWAHRDGLLQRYVEWWGDLFLIGTRIDFWATSHKPICMQLTRWFFLIRLISILMFRPFLWNAPNKPHEKVFDDIEDDASIFKSQQFRFIAWKGWKLKNDQKGYVGSCDPYRWNEKKI